MIGKSYGSALFAAEEYWIDDSNVLIFLAREWTNEF